MTVALSAHQLQLKRLVQSAAKLLSLSGAFIYNVGLIVLL